jgi:hypothetical protein
LTLLRVEAGQVHRRKDTACEFAADQIVGESRFHQRLQRRPQCHNQTRWRQARAAQFESGIIDVCTDPHPKYITEGFDVEYPVTARRGGCITGH